MRGNASKYANAQMTQEQCGQQRHNFLYMSRIEKVRAVTAAELMARHGGTLKENEYALAIALQKRAGE